MFVVNFFGNYFGGGGLSARRACRYVRSFVFALSGSRFDHAIGGIMRSHISGFDRRLYIYHSRIGGIAYSRVKCRG